MFFSNLYFLINKNWFFENRAGALIKAILLKGQGRFRRSSEPTKTTKIQKKGSQKGVKKERSEKHEKSWKNTETWKRGTSTKHGWVEWSLVFSRILLFTFEVLGIVLLILGDHFWSPGDHFWRPGTSLLRTWRFSGTISVQNWKCPFGVTPGRVILRGFLEVQKW